MVSQDRRRNRHVKVQDFSSLDSSHPYGVLPGGNRFFLQDSSSSDGTKHKHEKEQDIFNDDVWQNVLGFCDGTTLARVTQSSKYLYVAGHQPELWRDLVLRQCYSSKKTISKVGACWKDTFVLNQCSDGGDSGEHSHVPHQPMSVSGVYSDTYYRMHICRSFAIPPSWLEEGTNGSCPTNREVPQVSANEMTAQKFFDDYEHLNKPVVVQGAAKDTRAVKRWHDYEYMSQGQPCNTSCSEGSRQNKSFRATSGAAPLPGNFPLNSYRKYCDYPYLEESPLYLFDRTAITTNATRNTSPSDESWANDFFPEFYDKCPYWDPSGKHGHDLLQYLGDQKRPDHTWLIMGPKRSGSVFHIDPNATHAWNACIVGRKRWIFYPPGCTPPGVHPSEDGDEVAIPLSVGEWLTQYWTEHMQRYKQQPPSRRPMECTTHPGDVIFVPHGWWHSVVNLDGPCNIAITHNYVSTSNLGNVLKFFQDKQDQISGCRDRAESVKPEHLYETFSKALEPQYAEALTNAKSQKGWTCAAWHDATIEDGTEKADEDKSTGSNAENATADNKQQANSRKRQCPDTNSDHTIGENDTITKGDTESSRSVMAKTEKVSAFSFSFL